MIVFSALLSLAVILAEDLLLLIQPVKPRLYRATADEADWDDLELEDRYRTEPGIGG